jgi:hypothetical protein
MMLLSVHVFFISNLLNGQCAVTISSTPLSNNDLMAVALCNPTSADQVELIANLPSGGNVDTISFKWERTDPNPMVLSTMSTSITVGVEGKYKFSFIGTVNNLPCLKSEFIDLIRPAINDITPNTISICTSNSLNVNFSSTTPSFLTSPQTGFYQNTIKFKWQLTMQFPVNVFTTTSGVGDIVGLMPNVSGTASFQVTPFFSTPSGDCNGDTKIFQVVVNTGVASLANFQPVCANNSQFQLTGGSPAGGTYSGTGVSGNQFNPTTAGVGTHTITYTVNSGGCPGIATNTITVNPLPTANAGNDITVVCGSTTITATGTGGTPPYSFVWTGGFGNPTSVSTSGTYEVTLTDAKGCKDTDDMQFTVTGASVSIIPDPPSAKICAGLSIKLKASGGTSWKWSTSPQQTSQEITDAPSISTLYMVTVTVSGCPNPIVAQQFVTVNPLPTVSLGTDKNICFGGTVTLDPVGSPNASYSFSPSSTPSSTSSGTYKVTATDNNSGCTATDEININVNAQVNASISANPSGDICPNDPIVLKATGSGGTNTFTYQWDNSLGSGDTKNVMPIPSNPTYNVTVTDNFTSSNGAKCTATASKTITFKAAVSVVPTQEGPYCEGAMIKLHANATNATNFQWSGPSGISVPADANPTIANATTAMNGTYTVTASGGSVCPGVATVSVVVVKDPTISIQAGVFTICNGGMTTLTALTTPVSGLGSTITWQKKNVDGTFSDQASGTTFNTPNLTQTTTYRAKIDYAPLSAGCNQAFSDEVAVVVVNDPHINIEGQNLICKNQQVIYKLKSDVPILGSTIIWEVTGTPPSKVTNENGIIIVQWGLIAGTVKVTQKIGSGITSCSFSKTLSVSLSTATNNTALPASAIGYFPPNNILICKDSAKCYQWGYYDKVQNQLVQLPETFQAYGAGTDFKDSTSRVYWVKTWKAPCSDSTCATISFRTEIIESNPAAQFKILLYPNPNNGDFNLEVQPLPSGAYEVDIYDPIGRLVRTKPITVGVDELLSEHLEVAPFSNGLYFAVLRRDNAVFLTRSFVVQN